MLPRWNPTGYPLLVRAPLTDRRLHPTLSGLARLVRARFGRVTRVHVPLRSDEVGAGRPAMVRPRLPALAAPALLFSILLLVLALPGAGVSLGDCQSQPGLVVISYRWEIWEGGSSCRVYAEGILGNEGEALAAVRRVDVMARAAADGRMLASGSGSFWLDVLAPGEEGPFSAATAPIPCDETVGEIEFDIIGGAAAEDRYRDLTVTGLVRREEPGGVVLYGELVNTGRSYLNAADQGSRVYFGFWRGSDLIGLAAARLPVLNLSGATGQPHPPGFRYPLSVAVPDGEYDRVVAWPRATTYPDDAYPVPLGLRDITASVTDDGLLLAGLLYNCGTSEATDVVFVLVGRDGRGQVLDYSLAVLEGELELGPGEVAPVELTWQSVASSVGPEQVQVHPFSLQTQPDAPTLVPCDRLVGSLHLPVAWRP